MTEWLSRALGAFTFGLFGVILLQIGIIVYLSRTSGETAKGDKNG